MIIDKTKEKYKHMPLTLEGRVLLDEVVDEKGKIKGWHTVDAGIFKHHANHKTPEQLDAMGYSTHMDKINAIKGREDIQEKMPKGVI